ncbi:hypothetical protein L2E82_35645 [Cichorium intybus]|uniref:Uncharacterized protein n=1 Tax=Cichorium intybus TaxID=13427 RepID=A0ACB9BPC7_CICIN|nr:hypothetical protein L2E82_35645 [Cichorium intybus]
MGAVLAKSKVNIPLVKLIKEVPAYAKFLKDMCIHMRKIQAYLPILDTLPPKMEDPGAPLISVDLGDIHIKKTLLDLGASVNILPRKLFDKHEFGTLEHRDIILQLANKSTKIPRGMLSGVIIRVDNLYYLVYFLNLFWKPTNKDQCLQC